MKDSYLIECLEKFHELPVPLQDMIGGFEACLEIKTLEEVYHTPLNFVVILIAIGELTIDDVADYLNLKFGLDKIKGEEIADQLEEKIFTPVLDSILELNRETDDVEVENNFGPITAMPLSQKKEFILKTFSQELITALTADPDKIKDFNIALFQAFNEDDDLEDKVESLLYNNQEKISGHQIILDGHPASPSIANWLKDFIKKYGSDLFDEVALAEYLSQSLNVKPLKPEEKELVRKVLKLYRNLVFFPESMDGIVMENWEIIPISKNEIPVRPAKNISTEIPADPIVTERQKTIFDLQKNLTKYPTNSLEYKAIQQEINRLSRK